ERARADVAIDDADAAERQRPVARRNMIRLRSGAVGLHGIAGDFVHGATAKRRRVLVEHDLFRKPVSTFRDHALRWRRLYHPAPQRKQGETCRRWVKDATAAFGRSGNSFSARGDERKPD